MSPSNSHSKSIAAECCTCLPVCHSCQTLQGLRPLAPFVSHLVPFGVTWVQCLLIPKGHDSFGCSVNLPLGSRSADPHSTAVWCGNLLHSCPQPHTTGLFRSSLDGVFATTTKICARRHSSEVQTPLALQSPMSFYMLMLCFAATAAVSCETNLASLTWAPSIFGAARFGR